MASITDETIQQLLDEISKLKATIDSAGEPARSKLADIKTTESAVLQTIPITAGTEKVDNSAWDQKPEKDQNASYNRLVHVRDSLRSAAGLDGPTDSNHLMYGEYASTYSIITWLLLSFLFVGALLSTIVCNWSIATTTDFAPKVQDVETAVKDLEAAKKNVDASVVAEADARKAVSAAADSAGQTEAQKQLDTKSKELAKKRVEVEIAQQKANAQVVLAIEAIKKGGATEQVVLSMVVLFGALGGSLHLVTSLVLYVGNGQLKRRWLPYYLSLPIAGAALAPIVYMLLRVGILTPSGIASSPSGTASLNLVGIYAFSALTGMFAKTATDKLSEVFSTIFRTGEQPAKDKIGSGKPQSA